MERSSAVRYTYQDLRSLPESPTRRHEILDGRSYVSAAPRVISDALSWQVGRDGLPLRLDDVFGGVDP